MSAYDWSAARADNRDVWISHILRREAEALILPNLPAFLEGNYQPRDNDERLALLGVCQFKDLRGAEAGLYAAAFAADPRLAEDLKAGCRYRAACAAALAGCGGGADGAKLSEEERARWRKQALRVAPGRPGRLDQPTGGKSRGGARRGAANTGGVAGWILALWGCAIRTPWKDCHRPNVRTAVRCGANLMTGLSAPGLPDKPRNITRVVPGVGARPH